MTKRDTLTIEVLNWMHQTVTDSVTWARDVNGVKDAGKLEAFEAGIRKGYMDAYHTLSLHGHIKA